MPEVYIQGWRAGGDVDGAVVRRCGGAQIAWQVTSIKPPVPYLFRGVAGRMSVSNSSQHSRANTMNARYRRRARSFLCYLAHRYRW